MVELENSDPRAQSDWIVDAIPAYSGTMASLVPPGFSSYIRVLHLVPETNLNEKRFVSSGVVADKLGLKVDSETQWEALGSLLVDDLEKLYEAPEEGSLDKITLASLIEILANEYTSREFWMAVWDGYDVIDSVNDAQTFELFNQKYRLCKGTAASVVTSVCPEPFYQSPNMIWPEDQSWFIAIDVDFRSTYIGCSKNSASALLSDFRDRAFEVSSDTTITLSQGEV